MTSFLQTWAKLKYECSKCFRITILLSSDLLKTSRRGDESVRMRLTFHECWISKVRLFKTGILSLNESLSVSTLLIWRGNGNGCIQRSLKRPLGKGGTHFTQPLHNIFIKTRISIMNYNVPLTLHKIKSKCFGKNWSAYIQCYSRKITLLGDQTAFQRTRYLKLKWKNAPIWNSLW